MPQTHRGCEAFKSTTYCADKSIPTQLALSLELFEPEMHPVEVKTHRHKMVTVFVSIWLMQKFI
jgi:hypothetical protein